MKKDPLVYINHILESISAIEQYCSDISREEFLKNTQIQDAVCRRLEIIGEAANKLDTEFTDKYPDIPWFKIVAMRNILIHEYFVVDMERVYNTVQKDLSTLKQELSSI